MNAASTQRNSRTRHTTRSTVSHARHAPPADETARQRFLRLANPRVERALNSIRLIGNLANSGYDWQKEDIDAIQTAIQTAIHDTFTRFDKKPRGHKITFRLTEAPPDHN